MTLKTVIVFGAGYLAAEYAVFHRGLNAVPPEYRPGVLLVGVVGLLAIFADRYVATYA